MIWRHPFRVGGINACVVSVPLFCPSAQTGLNALVPSYGFAELAGKPTIDRSALRINSRRASVNARKFPRP